MKHCKKCGAFIGKKKHTCRTVWNKGKELEYMKNNTYTVGNKPNQTSFKKGYVPWNKDKQGVQEAWNKGLPINLNPKGSFKKGQTSGEKNINWKGGITPINEKIRQSTEYKLWRIAVFTRDNFTCVWCGDNTSGSLNADHIKPFAYYPELRFAIDNGRTLCEDCHRKTDTYLKKQT